MNIYDAITIARKSKMKFKLACIIINEDGICGVGYNSPVPTTKLKSKGYRSIHAEINALKNATLNFKKRGSMLPRGNYTAIVIRVKRNGTLGNAKSCNRCISHLAASGVKTLYYSNVNGEFEKLEM